jgi:tetratricopeptide (TPR) repeat protein
VADRIARARELADAKRFDEAASVLREVVAADSSDAPAFSLLARVLAWGRHYDESIATYRALLARTPDDSFDRAGYARVLAWSGRRLASLREFRRSIAADSTNLETRVGYARAMSWAGDLAGASREYFRTLAADSSYGDAWLGLATVARWRGAPTASDEFLTRAAARGADSGGVSEERDAVRLALSPRTGLGWTIARERQYVDASTTPFTLEVSGPLAQAGATLGRALGVRAQASRLRLWERRSALPSDTTLNYDLRASVFQGDASLLRYYPIQLSVGATYERLEARSGQVLYPLRSDTDFLGVRGRVWGYWGRVTPSASVSREFLPIKDRTTRSLLPGGVTNAELALGWQGSPRWWANAAVSRGLYSDENRRSGARAGLAYRMHLGRPRVALDYAWSYTDWDSASASYFTPLASVKHTVGIALDGWSDRLSLDYGARYQFSPIFSGNFPDLCINAWSGYLDAVLFDCIPVGLEGFYSIDNNQYTTWGLTASASVRW